VCRCPVFVSAVTADLVFLFGRRSWRQESLSRRSLFLRFSFSRSIPLGSRPGRVLAAAGVQPVLLVFSADCVLPPVLTGLRLRCRLAAFGFVAEGFSSALDFTGLCNWSSFPLVGFGLPRSGTELADFSPPCSWFGSRGRFRRPVSISVRVVALLGSGAAVGSELLSGLRVCVSFSCFVLSRRV
jgi:hypothetical protein